jgi:hypothetical protein
VLIETRASHNCARSAASARSPYFRGVGLHWKDHIKTFSRRQHVTKTLGAILNLKLVYVLVEKSAIPPSAGERVIDNTRAFCSIPARHDASRRTDAVYLAGFVATQRPSEVDSYHVARALVDEITRKPFWL